MIWDALYSNETHMFSCYSQVRIMYKMLTEILQFPVTIFDKVSDLYYNSTNAVHFS